MHFVKTLSRCNEDVSNFVIGYFGDARLMKTGALLFKRLSQGMQTKLKALGQIRAFEVSLGRFLRNGRVTRGEIMQHALEKTKAASSGRHVLLIQDTSEFNFPSQAQKKANFGRASNETKGFFLHHGLAVDAETSAVLGLGSAEIWMRGEEHVKKQRKQKEIAEKESFRWIKTSNEAIKHLEGFNKITIVADREADIYELFAQVPRENVNVLIRMSHNRVLESNLRIRDVLKEKKPRGTYEIELPPISGVRKKRKAEIELRSCRITLRRPQGLKSKDAPKNISINVVQALETRTSANNAEKPIEWILLTTLPITRITDIKNVVRFYKKRWIIEQIFRTMKKKGFQIDQSQITDPEKLLTLALLTLLVATKVLQLVQARDGTTEQKAEVVFEKEQIEFMQILQKKLEGKTAKQKNPHRIKSLAWASWIIARQGGWNGYASESPPGPITMRRGLERFSETFYGWCLGKDMCIG